MCHCGNAQVEESLSPAHCVRALQGLADDARDVPLSPEQLATAVLLSRSLHGLQADGASTRGGQVAMPLLSACDLA